MTENIVYWGANEFGLQTIHVTDPRTVIEQVKRLITDDFRYQTKV